MARILIAVDGSAPSVRALEFGASLAAKLGAGIVLLHTLAPVTLPLGSVDPLELSRLQSSLEASGRSLLAALADKASSYGVPVETELASGEPALIIHERSEAPDLQMVVMGSRGQGAVARLLLGSVAAQVVHASTKPVVVVR